MNKKIKLSNLFVTVISILFGIIIGVMLGDIINNKENPYLILIIIVSLIFSFIFHLAVHEAGHLIFGLISGYKFSSYRLFNLIWIKDGEKIKLKRLSISGTAGQCLMIPPDPQNGTIPFILYNLGGVIMNITTSMIFLVMFFILSDNKSLSYTMLCFSFVGFELALTNGIPMSSTMVSNDGKNILEIKKDPSAIRAFLMQFKVQERITAGDRLRDMPDEWFFMPDDVQMKNGIIAATGVIMCNRLMDMKRFKEARDLMTHLLSMESAINGLHRSLCVCDMICCGLILCEPASVISQMITPEQKKFMNAMNSFISVLRTEYAIALLIERNTVKANTILKRFEAAARKYPYSGDAQSERELIEIIKSIAA